MSDIRYSDEPSRRDIPSFIEARPPLIQNPFMRPRPQKGINLMEQFEEDSQIEEPELVQVYLRMKPCNVPSNLYEVRNDKCLVTSLDTTTAGHGRRTQHNVSRMYTFSKIFGPDCSQKEIFDEVVKENLKKLPDGHSFTLLTYGASGSGKTYTLMGTVTSPGLVPRALEYVFKVVDAAQTPTFKPSDTGASELSYAAQDFELQWVKRLRQVSAPLRDKYRRMSTQLHNEMTLSNFDLSNRTKYYVWVSFVEIYNEAIYDLLAPPEKRAKLRIREDSSGNVYVKGVSQAFVRSGAEAYDVMCAGRHSLVVAATGVHAHSSRSHCIFTITLLTEHDGMVTTSHIRLCDLAGCERQRAARNTGARMQESRAINSSLHVLERCLHMLRRKQRSVKDASLVPYRESKLTRLLGAGLSGARGEAVGMVVTLHPAPQFAHETRHVLSLAAVAQDIQINNTMYASTFESNESQDTTIATSSELIKLRADNERLHFELVQAQTRNKELQAQLEENTQRNADTMQELVDETKDFMKQYYDSQIDKLKAEMEEMREEYESKLLQQAAPSSGAGTPPKYLLQAKVEQLMTEITVLEDQLSDERLARARAEKEVQHLRTCIEERDEKAFTEAAETEEVPQDESDDESEEESDPFNESLEPIFKKESQNTSRAVNKSLKLQQSKIEDTGNETMDTISDEDCVSEANNTLKDESNVTPKASIDNEVEEINKDKRTDDKYESMDDFSQTFNNNEVTNSKIDLTDSVMNDSVKDKDKSVCEEIVYESTKIREESPEFHDAVETNITNTTSNALTRGTYFVTDDTSNDKEKKINPPRGTYYVDSASIVSEKNYIVVPNNKKEIETVSTEIFKPKKMSETYVNKIFKSLKLSQNSDSSLRQFENLEMAANNFDFNNSVKSKGSLEVGNIKMLNEKRTYFDDRNDAVKIGDKPVLIGNKTEINARDGENPNVLISDQKQHSQSDDKIDKPKRSYLTAAAKVQEEQLYFHENVVSTDEILISRSGMKKRPYFDTTDVTKQTETDKEKELATNKILNDIIIESLKDQDRSPSIVKDDLDKEYKPSTIKKLLGDSYTTEMLSSKSVLARAKKHDSLDLFESPQIKNQEVIENIERVTNTVIKKNVYPTTPTKTIELSNVEVIQKSIERLVIEQKSRVGAIVETKADSLDDKEVNKNIDSTQPLSEVQIKLEINTTGTCESLDNTQSTKENTIDAFENICKDLSNVRATEFELLVTQDINTSDKETEQAESKKENNKKAENELKVEETKYNLRKKGKSVLNDSDDKKPNLEKVEEESNPKGQEKPTTVKRNLRLRRRRIVDEDDTDKDNESKLKDIINLKKEFSDVTLGVPVANKEVKDIPSPDKLAGDNENLPPMGIQSCPAKSVTRSRRKLFTPRAEPLEESVCQGDSTERLYVPRPSYHRARARRKL